MHKECLLFLKALLILLLAGFVGYCISYRGTSDVPFDVVADALRKGEWVDRMAEVQDAGLKRYYGLNAADYEGVLLYTAAYGMEADELLLIRVKDEEQIEEVELAIDRRLKHQRDSFAGYAPEAFALIDDAAWLIRGDYIFLCVSSDADACKQAFVQVTR